MSMSSSNPYIVRALYEWILDNECTPYVLVNAMADHVQVPQQFVKGGQIVLNISPSAIVGLTLTNETIQFNGRFGGVPMDVHVPMTAVMGIYARENGQGMMFDVADNPQPDPPITKVSKGKTSKPSKLSKPSLKVVK
jgi:stringent starvation protein B